MAGQIDFIEDVEREIKNADGAILRQHAAECQATEHRWRELQTSSAATVTYCQHCLKIKLGDHVYWPINPEGGA